MHSPDFEWDELRYLLAVARQGSTIAAARVLGVRGSRSRACWTVSMHGTPAGASNSW